MKRMQFYGFLISLVATLAAQNALAQSDLTVAWQDSYKQEAEGKYRQAVASIELILRESPTHEFALMRRAWLNYLQGQHNDALDDYSRILAINPKSIEARQGMTLTLMAQKRWREAALEAHRAIAISAWDYTSHLRMMICEEAEHQWEDLERHATALSAHYPADAAALVYLARAEAWQGNVKGARAAYAKVLERVPAHMEAGAYLKNNPE